MARRLLVALLVLALPVQAALASSRWLCVAMAVDAPSASAPHDHAAAHGGAAHAHDAAPDPASGTSHDEGGCNLCAACTVTAATPPAILALAAVEATDARIPSLDAAVPRSGTGGPERPPRTL
jgi:hypothetical protein